MKTLKRNKIPAAAESSDKDILTEFRHRNLMILGWVTVPALLPISFHNFYHGRYLLGILMILIVLIALINSFAIKYKNRTLIHLCYFFALMFITILIALKLFGADALYWCYPVFFSIYFLIERSVARKKVIFGLFILIPYVFFIYDIELASRFSISLCTLCYFNDIQNGVQTSIYNRMTQLIIRDPLTNAFNRRHMNTCIQNVIEESNRGLGPVSLLLMDIDHFKKVNDELGHEAGDQVLKAFVDILHKRQRKIDYVFRTGGEEFVVLLRNTELKQAVLIAEDIRQHIEEAELIEDQKVTTSIGAAQYLADESGDKWLKRADDNMYEAKNLGRNRIFPQINSPA